LTRAAQQVKPMLKGSHHSPETHERMSASGNARKPDSPETRELKRQGQVRRWSNPENHKRQSEAQLRAWDGSPDRRKQQAERSKRVWGKIGKNEFARAIGEGQRKAWAKPGASARRTHMSDLNKEVWAEHRAKVEASGRLPKSTKPRGGRPRDPETAAVAAVIVEARERRVPQVSWSKMPEFLRKATGRSLSIGACRSLYDHYRTPAAQLGDAATGA
jgi:hypothetical protein